MRKYYIAPGMITDAEPLDYVKAARDAGYDGVGLRLQNSPRYPTYPIVGNAPLIRDIKNVLGDAGMSVLDILAFYIQPPHLIESFEPALSAAADLGARYLLTQSDDSDWSRICDNIGRFCALADEYRLTPIVEYIPNRALLNTLDAALKLAGQIGRPHLPILVDPVHLIRSEGNPADLIDVDARHFPYAQMSDGILAPGEPNLDLAKKLGAGVRRMPGDGMLPLQDIFDALPADIDISVEVIMERDPAISPRAWAQEGLDRTKAFFRDR
jgi:sugar phosphate isomerase/epimerase